MKYIQLLVCNFIYILLNNIGGARVGQTEKQDAPSWIKTDVKMLRDEPEIFNLNEH
jgi:hypothetical protein